MGRVKWNVTFVAKKILTEFQVEAEVAVEAVQLYEAEPEDAMDGGRGRGRGDDDGACDGG